MDREIEFSLDELADAFALTPRTARHYIEHVLPAGHKTGRGRKARYGQDTWTCFAFIRAARRDGLTLPQIARLLRELDQRSVGRVARGLESLTIVPTAPAEAAEFYSSPCMAHEFAAPPEAYAATSTTTPRWQLLYFDDELQIAHQGHASGRQREQVRMAAAYIKRVLAGSR